MKTIETAVIGYGFAGRSFHSYLVNLAPRLNLRGVCSRSPETRAKIKAERRCHAYASFGEVLADSAVELVVLATPHHAHCPQAIAALEAGKHVVTDKVMCLDLAECDRLIAAAKASGKLLTVFHNRRWDGDFLTLKQTLLSGKLGDVRWMEFAWQPFGAPGKWRGQADAGGGRFYDLGSHLLDQLLHLFDAPVETVYARMHWDFETSDTDSHALAVLTFADGRTGIVDASSMCAAKKPRYYVLGTKGSFVKSGIDPQERAMIDGDIDSAVDAPETYGQLVFKDHTETIPTIPGRWRNFYENVGDVLLDGVESAIKLPEMRRLMQVIDAARTSARTGDVVRIAG